MKLPFVIISRSTFDRLQERCTRADRADRRAANQKAAREAIKTAVDARQLPLPEVDSKSRMKRLATVHGDFFDDAMTRVTGVTVDGNGDAGHVWMRAGAYRMLRFGDTKVLQFAEGAKFGAPVAEDRWKDVDPSLLSWPEPAKALAMLQQSEVAP